MLALDEYTRSHFEVQKYNDQHWKTLKNIYAPPTPPYFIRDMRAERYTESAMSSG